MMLLGAGNKHFQRLEQLGQKNGDILFDRGLNIENGTTLEFALFNIDKRVNIRIISSKGNL
jgi:hypothetical protein